MFLSSGKPSFMRHFRDLLRGCEKSVRKRHQGVFFSDYQGVSLEVDFRWYGVSDCALGSTANRISGRIQLSPPVRQPPKPRRSAARPRGGGGGGAGGGHLLKKLGDELMALFGYPHARENDAERGRCAPHASWRACHPYRGRRQADRERRRKWVQPRRLLRYASSDRHAK